MFAEYEINYKNEGSRQHGLLPVRRPSIPAPERRVTETEIEGRDGVLIEDGETWGPPLRKGGERYTGTLRNGS